MRFKNCAIATCLVLCLGMAVAQPERPFTIIDSAHVYNLNPHMANYSSDAQMLTGLYEGLFSYDPQTLEPVYAIAETHKVSRNKLRWTFTIRENARFSNGEQITAQTIKDSWLNLLAPETNAPFASLLDCIKGAYEYRTGVGSAESVGITVQGLNRLSVTLNAPTEHLSHILCHHAFAAVHPDPTVYSGAFTVQSYDGNILRLKKNQMYHDAQNVALDEIVVIQSDDAEENAYLFNTGAADWVVASVDLNSIIEHDAIFITAEFATEYMFFKADRFPWNRSDFRNALLMAVPWEQLRSQAFVQAETFIYPVSSYNSPAPRQ